jgi:hypothetical protein
MAWFLDVFKAAADFASGYISFEYLCMRVKSIEFVKEREDFSEHITDHAADCSSLLDTFCDLNCERHHAHAAGMTPAHLCNADKDGDFEMRSGGKSNHGLTILCCGCGVLQSNSAFAGQSLRVRLSTLQHKMIIRLEKSEKKENLLKWVLPRFERGLFQR